jgi:hypothetical protein
MSQIPDLKPVLTAVDPEEAIAFFRQKGFRIGFDYRDVWQQEHQAAFTVAKAMHIDILKDIREFVDQAIADGTTLATFQKELMPRLQARGWWGKQEMADPLTGEAKLVQLGSPSRLELIYDTNLATAYSEGQWERIQRNKELFPFLEYIRSASVNPRHTHLAYAGLVLPVNDPFWASHLPIKEYKCKCTVVQHTQRMLDREGLKVGTAPPEVMRTVLNKRTGEVMQVPTGVHPAFNYPPGGRLANLEKMLADKQAVGAAMAMRDAPGQHKVHRMPLAPGAVQKIEQSTGFNLANYKVVFDNSSVGHALKMHGDTAKEAKLGQLAVTVGDFKHVALIVNEADSVTHSAKTTAQDLDALVFSKVINDVRYVLVKELRKGRKHLAMKTMFKKKGVGGSEAP